MAGANFQPDSDGNVTWISFSRGLRTTDHDHDISYTILFFYLVATCVKRPEAQGIKKGLKKWQPKSDWIRSRFAKGF